MATTYVALPQNEPSTLVGLNEMSTSFVIPAVGFVVNDIVQLFELPAGSVLIDFMIDMPILDTNVAPACTVDVGTDLTSGANGGLSPNGILAASSAGTNFSVATVLSKVGNVNGYQQGSLPFYYEPTLFGPGGNVQQRYAIFQMKIHAAPATTTVAAPTIWANIRYWMTSDAGIFAKKNL